MLPYYVTILLVALFAFAADNLQKKAVRLGVTRDRPTKGTKVFLAMSVIPLIFTAAFRYNIGTDFQAYYKADEIFTANPWEAFKDLNEPGITVLIRLVRLFSDENWPFVFCFSLLTIVASVPVLLKANEDYVFVLLLYIFTGCWHGAFNGVRQYMAAAVLMLGFHYILEKKLAKYLFTVFIAFLFHSSAIVMVVPYFVMRNQIRLRNVLLLAVGTLLVANNYDIVFRFLGLLKDTRATQSEYATNSVNILRVLANVAPAVAALVINYHKELSEKETFCINGLIMNAAAMVAASNSAYLARISIYTGYFIPLCLPVATRMENKKFEKMFHAGIVILFFIFWYVEVSGHPAMREFKWVWDRNTVKFN